MKKYKNVKDELKLKNNYGEDIYLLLTTDNKFYLYHSDCNTDYELITDKIPYVLDESEIYDINGFLARNGRPRYLKPKFDTLEDLTEYVKVQKEKDRYKALTQVKRFREYYNKNNKS